MKNFRKKQFSRFDLESARYEKTDHSNYVNSCCIFFFLVTDWQEAVRAFMIMSCLAAVASILAIMLTYLGKVPNLVPAIALAGAGRAL